MNMARRIPRRPEGEHRTRGFTLIEVLLATALAAALLLGLWSLFSIYTDLFETGQTKIETSQLARALLGQLADDLHSAIQDPIPGVLTKTRTSTPLRRFVLSGSRDQLRLDVLQLTPLQGNPTPVGDQERMLRRPSAARVPELRTVYYSFQDPLASSVSPEAEAPNLPGLVRREADFETPYPEQPDASLAGLETPTSGIPGGRAAGESGPSEAAALDVVDNSIIWVPEVVRLEFRYFDGSAWTSAWNSLTRKSLPVAVEVVIQLGTATELPGAVAGAVAGTESPELETSTELGEKSGSGLMPQREGPVYRLVVDVPGSPKHAAPRKVQPIRVRRPAPRRVVPRRPPPPRPTVQPLSDEWMRTQL